MAAVAPDAAVVTAAGIEARLRRIGEARATERRERIAAAIAEIGGVRATIEGEAVILSARGLHRRRLADARLRWPGSLAQ